jgi:precorrin-6Y C5,15-methyltransferase (decarboxylating)
MQVPRICVIGLPNRADFVPSDDVRRALAAHRVFCGGERHREIVRRWLPLEHRWVPVRGAVRAIADVATEVAQPVAVLASGDPLFFGIAGALRAAMPKAQVRVLPWFTSLQLLSHRIGLAYEHMTCVSVHGRGWHELDTALIRGDGLIGALTDADRTPAAIARRLRDYGFTQYRLHIGEALESPQERVTSCTIDQAAAQSFDPLNCVMLQADRRRGPRFGIPEAELAGLPGRPDMITKMPVRLTSLAQLDLPNAQCLWDVGFCTGSVAIEARLRFPYLTVVAFERRAESADLLDRNARDFGAPGIVPVIGDIFEQDLASWPAPDAVFIGGHGGRLDELVERIDRVLAPGGRIVINAVRESSVGSFMAATARLGYTASPAIHLQVDSHNPIVVLGATKPPEAVSR